MRDVLKKIAIAGVTYGGLEYAKYRLRGGIPLLKQAQEIRLRLMDIRNRIENMKPIVLSGDECKII